MRGSDSKRTDDRGSRNPNFDNRSDNRDRGPAQPQHREDFEALNAKLDKILKLLSPEKSIETPITTAKPQAENAATSRVEAVTPAKKKPRAKKLAPTEDTMENPAIIETPGETDIPTETPTE